MSGKSSATSLVDLGCDTEPGDERPERRCRYDATPIAPIGTKLVLYGAVGMVKPGRPNGARLQRTNPMSSGVGSPMVVRLNCSFSPDFGFRLKRRSERSRATG